MQALIYKDFSDSYNTVEIGTGKVKEILTSYNNDNYTVIVNGTKADGETEIKDGDAVIVRTIPHVTGALIAGAIVAVGAAVTAGVVAYKAKKQSQEAQEEADKLSNQLSNSGVTVDSLPTMAGASNTTATGKTQPFIMGHRLWTPYFMTDAWTNRNGSQYVYGTETTVSLNVDCTATYNHIWSCFFAELKITAVEACEGTFNVAFGGYTATFGPLTKGQSVSWVVKTNVIAGYTVAGISGTFTFYSASGWWGNIQKASTVSITGKAKSLDRWVDDNDEYAIRVLQGGFAQQAIKQIKGDDVVLCDFTASEDVVTSGIYYCSSDYFKDSFVEIRQNGEAFETEEFNYKMDTQEVSDELKLSDDSDYEDLLYTLPAAAKTVNIALEFPQGLYGYYTGTGEEVFREISTEVDYSVDGGTTYTKLGTQFNGNGTMNRDVKADIFFVLDHTFTDAEIINAVQTDTPIIIKVRCLTGSNVLYSTEVDSMQITKVRCRLCDEAKAKAGTVTYGDLLDPNVDAHSLKIGLKLKTTSSNEDKVGKIQIDTYGMARIWDSTNKEWGTEKVITRNPAAWLLEVLTSDTHLPSKLDDSEIDLDSFGDWYEYCDTNSLNIDSVLMTGDTKENVIKNIAAVGNATLYRSIYGKRAVAIDDVKTNAVAVLNPQNIISFSAEKDMTRVLDGYKITFTVADTWKTDTEIFMRDGSDGSSRSADSELSEITLNNIIAEKDDNSQIYKYARRKINGDILRVHEYSVEIGQEGYFFTPYSKVLVQNPALYTGLGSATIKEVITSGGYVTGLKFYTPVEYSSLYRYGLVINAVSSSYSKVISAEYTASTEGNVTEVTLTEPIAVTSSIPYADNICSFGYLNDDGEFTTITNQMTITGIEPTSNGVKLTGLDYDDALFDYGTIPTYHSNLTLSRGVVAPPEADYATVTDIIDKTAGQDAKIADAVARVDDMEEIVENLADDPVVYASLSTLGFAVNDQDVTTMKQEIDVTVYARQGSEYLDFYFDEKNFVFPDGFTYTIDGHKITIIVPEGLTVTTAAISIPVIFTAYKYDYLYSDSNGYEYTDENGADSYGVRTELSYTTTYALSLTAIGVQGGRYLGAVSAVSEAAITIINADGTTTEKAVTSLIAGDYFSFCGSEDFESALCKAGTFYISQVYEFLGVSSLRAYMWDVDSSAEHCGGTLSDVLNVANESLAQNNSNATQFLNHLTANSIFVDRLVANTAFIDTLIANDAFINSLSSNSIFAKKLIANESFINSLAASMIKIQQDSSGKGGVIYSANYNGKIDESEGITHVGDTGWAIDYNGTADFNNMNATGGKFKEIAVVDGSFSGTLDCDVMKVFKDSVIVTSVHYTTSQAGSFFSYMEGLFPISGYEYNVTVESKWGSGRYILLNSSVKITSIKVYFSSRGTSYVYGYTENGVEYNIGIEETGSAVSQVFLYYDFKVCYAESDVTILDFSNLPTADPLVAGRAYKSGGYLKISSGS